MPKLSLGTLRFQMTKNKNKNKKNIKINIEKWNNMCYNKYINIWEKLVSKNMWCHLLKIDNNTVMFIDK